MRIAFILKGNSHKREQFYGDLAEVADFAPFEDVIIRESEYAGHPRNLAAELAASCDCLVAAGGDGTLNEVVDGCMQAFETGAVASLPRIGLLALGSANDFVKSTGFDGSLEQLISMLREDRCRQVDLGRISYRDSCEEEAHRYFVNVADLGIGADVVRRLGSSRSRLRPNVDYLYAIVSTFLHYRKGEMRIRSDRGLDWQGRCLALLAGNGKFFGSGLCALPGATLDSGELAVFLIGDVSLFDFLRKLPALRAGRVISHPQVSYHQAGQIWVDDVDHGTGIEADGEYLGTTPVEISVVPAALSMVLPAKDSG